MASGGDDLQPASEPEPVELLTPEQILLGQQIDPLDRVRVMAASQFEDFIREWAFHYLQQISEAYRRVDRLGGSGDLGRDVVGWVSDPSPAGSCDVFQCKHYAETLHPSNLWPELAKLVYHTHRGVIPIPRQYRFVCPHDVGPDTANHLADPEKLRAGLINNWSKHQSKIARGLQIELTGDLLAEVETFPFHIVSYKPIMEVIDEHAKTTRHAARFGGGLRKPLPQDLLPPASVQPHEARYVEELREAYADYVANGSLQLDGLAAYPLLKRHFERARQQFYCAETLREFARDTLPPNAPFTDVQDQVYDAVIDLAESDEHTSGYQRAVKTTTAATHVKIVNHPLHSYVKPKSLQGICHQLVDAQRLKWVSK